MNKIVVLRKGNCPTLPNWDTGVNLCLIDRLRQLWTYNPDVAVDFDIFYNEMISHLQGRESVLDMVHKTK